MGQSLSIYTQINTDGNKNDYPSKDIENIFIPYDYIQTEEIKKQNEYLIEQSFNSALKIDDSLENKQDIQLLEKVNENMIGISCHLIGETLTQKQKQNLKKTKLENYKEQMERIKVYYNNIIKKRKDAKDEVVNAKTFQLKNNGIHLIMPKEDNIFSVSLKEDNKKSKNLQGSEYIPINIEKNMEVNIYQLKKILSENGNKIVMKKKDKDGNEVEVEGEDKNWETQK